MSALIEGLGARGCRRVVFSAQCARHRDLRAGDSAVGGPDVRLHAMDGVHAQSDHAARTLLVAGVLVDDAIVEIENIVRHMRMGKSCFQAAIDAADEIGLAVVATSFTIIAVFLPVSFMGGVSGQYFKQFGLTVAAAVFISLMVARLITPVLAAYALRSDSLVVHDSDGPIMTRYLSLLRWCVANRWKTIAAGIVFFLLSVACLHDHSDRLRPARGFRQRRAGHRTAAGRHARGYVASLGGGRRHLEKIARGDRHRRIRGRRRRRDSQRHDLCQPGAAFRAQHHARSSGSRK